MASLALAGTAHPGCHLQVSSDESEKLIKMEDTLHQRVIGQEEAVVAISRAVRRARVGLKNPNRPIASFIFSGPTGLPCRTLLWHSCRAGPCGAGGVLGTTCSGSSWDLAPLLIAMLCHVCASAGDPVWLPISQHGTGLSSVLWDRPFKGP